MRSMCLDESAEEVMEEADCAVRDLVDQNDQRHAHDQDQQQRDGRHCRGDTRDMDVDDSLLPADNSTSAVNAISP